jgi:hypothetical protein
VALAAGRLTIPSKSTKGETMFRMILIACALVCAFPVFAQPTTTLVGEPGLTEPVAAQDVVSPEPEPAPAVEPASGGSDFSGIFKTITDSLSGALIALVTGAVGWLTAKLAQWTGAKIQLEDTLRDLHMEDYAKKAVEKAVAYGLNKTGVTMDDLQHVQIKNQVLQFAVNFLLSQYPEVIKWLDKDNNGIIDWVQTLLPTIVPATGPVPAKLVAKLDAAQASMFAPQTPKTAPQGLMGQATAAVAKRRRSPVQKSLDIPQFRGGSKAVGLS